MVVRTEDDDGNLRDLTTYPAVETIHEDSICTKTFMPPRKVPVDICEAAQKVATSVVATLWGRGVFAVEMFLLKDGTCSTCLPLKYVTLTWSAGSLLVNEVAPRPHNSGHYTIEAVPQMSQFKAQLYALLDLPLPKQLKPRVDAAIMLNILGGAAPDSHDRLVDLAERNADEEVDIHIHLYGKASKPSRKIGHVTVVGFSTVDDLESRSEYLVEAVDELRAERISAASKQLRPQEQPQRQPQETASAKPLVLVTMGSDSDLPVLKAGLDILEDFGVPYAVNITSAHRTPKYMGEVASQAAKDGVRVIIAAAGGAAHLPGMAASHTPLPVIGVPVKATHLDGQDSLLSIVQMPVGPPEASLEQTEADGRQRGVPVATVGINNSTNAALLAVRILGAFFPQYQEKMVKYQSGTEEGVLAKAEKLRRIGFKAYLDGMGK